MSATRLQCAHYSWERPVRANCLGAVFADGQPWTCLAPVATPHRSLSGMGGAPTAATLSRARPQRVPVLLQPPGLWFTPPPAPSASLRAGLPASPLSQPR